MGIIQKFKQWLAEPIDGRVLGLFRLVFGLFMAYEAYVYYRMGLIDQGLLAPKVLFKYDGLGWLHPISKPVMLAALGVMGVSGLLIAAGWFFRWACWLFALSLSFIFFQEKSYYNNHIYLFILLGILLSFTQADRFMSWRKNAYSSGMPVVARWQQFIFQAQIIIVYFYGGITKLKSDWLFRQEPIRSMAETMPSSHLMAPFVKSEFAIYALTYGGLLLDLLAPLLLWHKQVRRWALLPFVGFHLANSRIFSDIGIFPYVMLASLILFFETREIPWLRRLVKTSAQAPAPKKTKQKDLQTAAPILPPENPLSTPRWGAYALAVYFAFQLLFPFRGFFLPNNMDWTGIGKNFAWRMKVDTRALEAFEVTIHHPTTGQVMPVEVLTFVNQMQVLNMTLDVRSVAAFARAMKEVAAERGVPNAIVKARIMVRYNGRHAQLFVNPDVDLASVTYSPFKKLDWVIPLNK